jgi:2',3'-cyclic-nucleotide 2'-phosphodiesterase
VPSLIRLPLYTTLDRGQEGELRQYTVFVSESYSILFLGDIVGKPGRTAVLQCLPGLVEAHQPLFVVVNGENSAAGVGITPSIAEELFGAGVDAITLGNHAFNKREIGPYLDSGKPIVRPGNMARGVPGRGLVKVMKDGVTLAVANLCGRVYMDGYDDPFAAIDDMIATAETPHFLLDFHGEATSEKIGMGYHCEGRVTAVLGTHTHVQTADETVLPGGTATITDVGMCGPVPSVLGMDREIILRRFRTGLPERFEVASEPGVICGVVLRVIRNTGRAIAIERLRFANT